MGAGKMVGLGLIMIMATAAIAGAQDRACNEFENFIHPISVMKKFSTEHARAVDLAGDLAFVVGGQFNAGSYDSEFYIMEIVSPDTPEILGGIEDLPSLCNDVDLHGDHALVCAGSFVFDGILAIDVTDLNSPVVVDTFVEAGFARNLVFGAGDIAYAACGIDGFKVIDYADPLAPTVIGELSLGGSATCLTIDGDHAYVGTTNATAMEVVNISTPSAPTFVTAVDTPGNYTYGICQVGDYLYLADHSSGIYILDVSTPAEPTQIQSYPLDYGYSVIAAGNTLYVGGNGLFLLDITDPYEPGLISRINSNTDHFGLALAGNLLVAPAWTFGTMLVDVANPFAPQLTASAPTSTTAWHLDVLDDYAYVTLAGASYEVEVFDVSDPAAPVSEGTLPLTGFPGRPVAHWRYLYIPITDGIQVVDITDPTTPALGNLIPTGSETYVSVYRESYLYTAAGASGLLIHDAMDSTLPVQVGQANTTGNAYDVALVDDYAYVADGNDGLQVVNIANPGDPAIVGNHDDLNNYNSIAAFGHHVYMSDDSNFVIVDCSTPDTPVYLTEVSQPGTISNLQVKGDHLYVGTSNLYGSGSGVWLYELSTPAAPALVGYLATPHYASDFDTDGDHIFIAGGNYGIHTALRQCDPTAVLISDFSLTTDTRTVAITWQLAPDSDPGSFRLQGSDGTENWAVGFDETAPGLFSALDDHPSLTTGGEFEYTLMASEERSGWVILRRESLLLEATKEMAEVPPTGIDGAWPNPFNPATTISFNLRRAGLARLAVFDISGRLISVLHEGSLERGSHERIWNGHDTAGRRVGSGIYFAELLTSEGSSSLRLVLLK